MRRSDGAKSEFASPWARRGTLLIRLVLRDVALILALGSMAGLVIALGLGRLIASLVYGVSPHDPPTFLLAALVLAPPGWSRVFCAPGGHRG